MSMYPLPPDPYPDPKYDKKRGRWNLNRDDIGSKEIAAAFFALGLFILVGLFLHIKSKNDYPHLIRVGDEFFVCHMKKADAVDESLILGTITGFVEPPVFPDEDESTNVKQFVGQPYAVDGDDFYISDGKHWYVCSSASQYYGSTGFWGEFFTPNRFHRFDKLLISIDQDADVEQATEDYYARIRPYLTGDVYQKIVMSRMLYRYDAICREELDGINLPFKFEKEQASEEGAYNFYVTVYNKARTKTLEFSGSCTEAPDGTITSFYLDLGTLSREAGSFLLEFFEYNRLSRYDTLCADPQDSERVKKYHEALSQYVTPDTLSEIIDSEAMIHFDRICSEAGLTPAYRFHIEDGKQKDQHDYSIILVENGTGLVFTGSYTTNTSGLVDSFTINYPDGNEKAVEVLWQLQQEYNESCHNDERRIVKNVIDQYIDDPMFYAHYADTPEQAIEMVTSLIEHDLGRSN